MTGLISRQTVTIASAFHSYLFSLTVKIMHFLETNSELRSHSGIALLELKTGKKRKGTLRDFTSVSGFPLTQFLRGGKSFT